MRGLLPRWNGGWQLVQRVVVDGTCRYGDPPVGTLEAAGGELISVHFGAVSNGALHLSSVMAGQITTILAVLPR